MRHCAIVLVILAFSSTPAFGQDDYVYWTNGETHEVMRGEVGAHSSEVVLRPRLPWAIDFEDGWMYWVDGGRAIKRSRPDGIESTVVANISHLVHTIAVGLPFVYWHEDDVIRRTHVDAHRSEDLVESDFVRAVAVDSAEKKLFWISKTTIYAAGLEGADATAIVEGLSQPEALAVDSRNGKLYWTDGQAGLLQRSNLDGSAIDTLVAGGWPRAVAVDFDDGILYWSDAHASTLNRADLDGSNAVVLAEEPSRIDQLGVVRDTLYWLSNPRTAPSRIHRFIPETGKTEEILTGFHGSRGLAFHAGKNQLHWADSRGIFRSDADGSNATRLIDDGCGIGSWTGIALDTLAGEMFWGGNTDCINNLWRADLEGNDRERPLRGATYPAFLAVDAYAGRVYWSDTYLKTVARMRGHGFSAQNLIDERACGVAVDLSNKKLFRSDCTTRILRSELDGTGSEVIVDGLNRPADLALDVAGGKIYWTESSAGRIRRSNLDGSDVEDVFVGLENPEHLALTFQSSTVVTHDARLTAAQDTLFFSNQEGAVNEVSITNTGPERLRIYGLRFSTTAHGWSLTLATQDTSYSAAYAFGRQDSPDSFPDVRLDVSTDTLRIQFDAYGSCLVCKASSSIGDTLFIYSSDPNANPRAIPIDFSRYVGTERPEIAQPFSVDVFPNPSAGTVRIRITADRPGRHELTVFDALGRKISRRYVMVEAGIPAELLWPDGESFSAGLYFVRVTDGRSQISQPIAIVR